MKKIHLLLLIPILTACTSHHNIKEGGNNPLGGGFIDEKIDDGLYELVARSNFALWATYSSAEKTFSKRAEELCRSGHLTLQSDRWSYDSTGMNHIIAQIHGFILCEDSAIKEDEAREIISQYKSSYAE